MGDLGLDLVAQLGGLGLFAWMVLQEVRQVGVALERIRNRQEVVMGELIRLLEKSLDEPTGSFSVPISGAAEKPS